MTNVAVSRDTTDYVGPVTWRGERVERVDFAGGYATIGAGGCPEWHYYTADHLGNNRVVTAGADGTVEQLLHYYPFGGTYTDAGIGIHRQQLKHCGKELDPAYGWNAYDFHARHLHADLPWWTCPDALARKYPHLSPYAYCANNPVNLTDPTGMKLEISGLTDTDWGYLFYETFTRTNGYLIINRDNKTNKITYTIDQSKTLNNLQEEIVNAFTTIIDSDQTTTLKAVHGTEVKFGDAKSGQIDMWDIKNFSLSKYKNGFGVFIHEMTEQYNIQVLGNSDIVSHIAALKTERNCMGYDENQIYGLQNEFIRPGLMRMVYYPIVNGKSNISYKNQIESYLLFSPSGKIVFQTIIPPKTRK